MLLSGEADAQVRVADSGKQKLDEQLINETYRQVATQTERRGLTLTQRPEIELRVVSTEEAERAMRDCVRGGCGHILRFGVTEDQTARVVFLSLAPKRARLWMDGPDGYMLAKAIAVVLDYENRLYLSPEQIHQIADSAGLAAYTERRGKVSVEALRHQQ